MRALLFTDQTIAAGEVDDGGGDLAVVGLGVVLAGVHWEELTKDVVDRAITPENLLLLWLVYPAVKALHELGHGYAVKRWGGEVHEIGRRPKILPVVLEV